MTAAASAGVGSAVSQLSGTEALLRTAGSLVVVLLLVFAIAWLFKRLPMARSAAGQPLQVRGGLRLGAREKLVIVRARGRDLLLGVTPGRIELLTELDGDDNAFADTLSVVERGQQP